MRPLNGFAFVPVLIVLAVLGGAAWLFKPAVFDGATRRAAVMEGRADEAARLYRLESAKSADLKRQLASALADRRAADEAISEAAAGQLAAEH